MLSIKIMNVTFTTWSTSSIGALCRYLLCIRYEFIILCSTRLQSRASIFGIRSVLLTSNAHLTRHKISDFFLCFTGYFTVSEWMSEWVSEWVSMYELGSEWVSEWVSIYEPVSEWVRKYLELKFFLVNFSLTVRMCLFLFSLYLSLIFSMDLTTFLMSRLSRDFSNACILLFSTAPNQSTKVLFPTSD